MPEASFLTDMGLSNYNIITWTSKMPKMPKIMDPVLPILSILGYGAILLGTFGGPGMNENEVCSNVSDTIIIHQESRTISF